MLLKCIVAGLLLFSSLRTTAQRIIINGEETLRLLRWDDFRGSPDHGSPYFAFTYWNTSYKYDGFVFKGDTVKWKVQITLDLGQNSWRKKDKVTDSLLKHEQGHFDVGILCVMELQEKINKTVFLRNDYQIKIKPSLYKKIHIIGREANTTFVVFFA